MMKRLLLPALAVAGLTLLIAGLTIAHLSSRADTVEAVPVALVNRDEPVTNAVGGEEQTIAAGRSLAAEITGAVSPLAWTLVDADALDFVETDYYAIVTIPEDFSAVVSGLRNGDARQATVILETDDPRSPLAAQIVGEITEASTASFNDDITSSYLETVYESYDTIGSAVDEAEAGGTELTDSARELAEGADELASGGSELAAGAQDAAESGRSLSSGAADLASGAAGVADGAAGVSASLSDATNAASNSLVPDASAAAAESAIVAETLAGLAQSCPPAAGPSYCGAVVAAAQASVVSARSAAMTDTMAAGLSSALMATSSASAGLANGAADVSSGAASLAEGTEGLAAAMGELATGAAAMAQSSADVASGAHGVADGAASLTEGLSQLADSVPAYDESIRVDLADAVASPAKVSSPGMTTGGPELFGSIAAALALWVGCAAMFVRARPVPAWALAAGASASRAVVIGLLPRLGIAAFGALVLWALLAALGAAGPDPGWLLVVLLLGACCLTGVLHAIFAVTGRAGFLVAAVVGLVQLAAAGLFAPIEMAGPAWEALSAFLPLSHLAQLTRDVIFGSPIEPLVSEVILAFWFLVAFTVSVTATRMKAAHRMTT